MNRRAAAAVVSGLFGVLVGCGPTVPEPPPPPPTACQPTTCSAAGATCGTLPDGCGGQLSCGTCGAGETCGGGGEANVCGGGTCEPTTCAREQKNCGEISDGCGRILECGSCASGTTCGGGGTPNVCGGESCTPTTCEAAGKNCGELSDGCGGTLQCGSCGAGTTCGGGGEANVCGAQDEEEEPNSSAKWLLLWEQPVHDLVARTGGDLVALRYEDEHEPELARVSPAGAMGWVKPIRDGEDRPTRVFGIEAAPSSDVFVYGGSDNPTGAMGGYRGFVWRLSADGQSRQTVGGGNDEGGTIQVLMNAAGATVSIHSGPISQTLSYEAPDGRRWYIGAADNDSNAYFQAAALAEDNTVVIAADFYGPVAVGARTFSSSGRSAVFLFKVDSRGEVVWAQEYPASFSFEQLERSAKGTVLATLSFHGALRWGDQEVSAPPGGSKVLLVAESDGRPRWMKKMPALRFDLDPAGMAAVLTPGVCDGVRVTKLSLSGEVLWERELTPEPCEGNVRGTPIILTNEEVVLGGVFEGSVDFGNGKKSESSAPQGFILNLGR